MLFTIVKFTSVQIPNSMYKYLSYDGQRIVMEVVIVQAEKTERIWSVLQHCSLFS